VLETEVSSTLTGRKAVRAKISSNNARMSHIPDMMGCRCNHYFVDWGSLIVAPFRQ
jgi:hypothetical protein